MAWHSNRTTHAATGRYPSHTNRAGNNAVLKRKHERSGAKRQSAHAEPQVRRTIIIQRFLCRFVDQRTPAKAPREGPSRRNSDITALQKAAVQCTFRGYAATRPSRRLHLLERLAGNAER